ncbi:hypothetical protein P0D87_15905 [Paraburkholderia sp. RL17-368-BIF-A]|uniref:hypothetical protein n=1 Tax=Paraburkholderia sp. RL17-368-BIF-A TaxID=3031628 RepID=UPI0038BE37DD
MSQLIVEPNAESDLDELFETDPDAAAIIDVLLDEIYGDEELIQLLCANRTARLEDPAFNNERFIELWDAGYTIYRLKIWDMDGGLLDQRVLHAYDGRSACTHILGILHRDYAYDTAHEKVRRCVEDYDAIGIYRAK